MQVDSRDWCFGAFCFKPRRLSKKKMFLGNVTGRHSIWNHLQPPTKKTTTQIWTSVLETWRKHEPITVQARKHYLAGSFQASPKPPENVSTSRSQSECMISPKYHWVVYDFPIMSFSTKSSPESPLNSSQASQSEIQLRSQFQKKFTAMMDPWIPLTKIDQKHRETGRQLSFWYSQGVSLGDRNLPKKP